MFAQKTTPNKVGEPLSPKQRVVKLWEEERRNPIPIHKNPQSTKKSLPETLHFWDDGLVVENIAKLLNKKSSIGLGLKDHDQVENKPTNW